MTKVQTLISKLTILAMIASLFAVVQPARAAALTNMSDTMSNQTISELSDHTILFDMSTTVVPGETITVTFESDYSIAASLDFEDLDLSYEAAGGDGVCNTGDTQLTLAAAAATPTWGAVRTSSTVITFTGGATIPGGSEVCVEIGTVATTGVTGAEQVLNPTALGSYTVSIGGTMTDSGTMATPIQDSDQVSITASVDPSITFDLDTSTADADTNAPYTVALGTITTSDTRVSGTTDSINGIWADLDTNASGGAVVTVQNANGANGLVSTSVGSDDIANGGTDLADGTEEYGICVASVAATTGTLAIAGSYAAPTTCAFNDETNDVESLTTTPAAILNTSGAPISAGRASIAVGASISGTVQAHNDYADTLTFIATGTF